MRPDAGPSATCAHAAVLATRPCSPPVPPRYALVQQLVYCAAELGSLGRESGPLLFAMCVSGSNGKLPRVGRWECGVANGVMLCRALDMREVGC